MLSTNSLDYILYFCADDAFQKSFANPTFTNVDIKRLIRKFRNNKISLQQLSNVVSKFASDINIPSDEIEKDIALMDGWSTSLVYLSDLFRKQDVKYVLIKVLNPKSATMTDLDILPPSGLDELKALDVLNKNGYGLYQYRLLAHPLKITATRQDTEIAVDFYPKPMWGRKIVCDSEIISSRAVVSYFNGVPAIYPSPEDDLYLFGTHAYYHLRFTYVEILHAINVLNSNRHFDWEYLYTLALDYGTADAIFTYLKLIEMYAEKFYSTQIVQEKILSKFLKLNICRKINSWLETNYSSQLGFPIGLPSSIAVARSSFYHANALISHESLIDTTYDFLSYYMNWGFKYTLDPSGSYGAK